MQKILTSYFTILLFISAVIGVIFPQYFISLNTYTAEILMIILFSSFLSLNITDMFTLNLKKLFFNSIIYIFGLPFLFYLIFSSFLDPTYLYAFLLFFALPSGMTNPGMSKLFNLDTAWATGFVVITSLAFPFLFTLFSPILPFEGTFSMFQIFVNVAKLIFIPFFLALLLKKISPKLSKSINSISSSITIIGLIIMILGIFAFNQEIFFTLTSSLKFLYFGIGMFFAYAVLLLVGFLLPAKTKKEQWTNALIFWGTNPIFFLVLASQFFPSEIFIGAFFAEICWIIFQVLFSLAYKKYY